MTPNLGAFLKVAKPYQEPRWCGVYVLLLGEQVIYVGQSSNIIFRIAAHRSSSSKTFDRVVWVETSVSDLNAYEGALARALNPAETWHAPANDGRDGEILEHLGLQPDLTRAFEIRSNEKRFRAVRQGGASGVSQKDRALRSARRAQTDRRDRLFAGLTELLAARAA